MTKTLILCLLLSVAQTQGNNGVKKAQGTSTQTQVTKPLSSGQTPTADTRKEATQEQADNDKPKHIVVDNAPIFHPSKDWWDKISVLCTILLVAVGIFTLLFIARQTTVAADAAQSAKAGIDVLIAENRPWLILSDETKVPASPPSDWKFPVIIKNYGKTPARITSYQVEAVLGTNSKDPPEPSLYTKVEPFPPFVLPQGEAIDSQKRLPEPWASDHLMTEKRFLWLCGLIQYSDTFARPDAAPYETAFCLVYKLPAGINKACWARSGRPEYNRVT